MFIRVVRLGRVINGVAAQMKEMETKKPRWIKIRRKTKNRINPNKPIKPTQKKTTARGARKIVNISRPGILIRMKVTVSEIIAVKGVFVPFYGVII